MNGKVGLAGILKGRAMAIHSLLVRMCKGYVCMYICMCIYKFNIMGCDATP